MKRLEILVTTPIILARGEATPPADPPADPQPPADPPPADPPTDPPADPPPADPPADPPPADPPADPPTDPPAADAWRENLPPQFREKTTNELVTEFNAWYPPKSPDEYTHQRAEDSTFQPDEYDTVRKMLYDRVGLSDGQFTRMMAVMEEGRKLLGDTREQFQVREREDAIKTLSDDVGNEEAGVMVNSATNFLRRTADQEFIDFLDESKMGNDPRFIRYFAQMNRLVSEDILHDFAPARPANRGERTPGGTPMLEFPSMEKKSE